VTGFEPFGGRSRNASAEAVLRLRAGWAEPEALTTAVLPVSFETAPARLRELVRDVDPDVVVCVGEAGSRTVVSLERVALNLVDARIPDNAGSAPVDRPVVPGGPAAYFSSLPVRACAAAVRTSGLPAEVSHTAGTFVCNALFYALMDVLVDGAGDPAPGGPWRGVRGGFVHVPAGLDGTASDADPERVAAALRAVVRTALDVTVDVPGTAGTID
jgi:pyroglutamyl-peptidase